MIQYLFLGLQIINYIAFMILDVSNRHAEVSSMIKYEGIILCFLYVFLGKRKERSGFIVAGLFFTAISDYFLLFTDCYAAGMLSFCAVQTVYSIYSSKNLKQYIMKEGLQLCIIGVILLCVRIGFQIEFDTVLIVSLYYFVHLVGNVLCSWYRSKEGKEKKLFALGMTLFLLCDIHVAIFNAESYLSVGFSPVYQKIYEVASVAMWFYYLPSQVLIALAGRNHVKVR